MHKLLLAAVGVHLALAAPAQAGEADVRFATFNASLNRNDAGQLVADLSTPEQRAGGARSPRSSSASGPMSC